MVNPNTCGHHPPAGDHDSDELITARGITVDLLSDREHAGAKKAPAQGA